MGKLQPEHEFWTNAHDNRGRTTSRRTWQTAGVADKSALEKTVRTVTTRVCTPAILCLLVILHMVSVTQAPAT
eukprot:2321112-Rhodomonas_salina.1